VPADGGLVPQRIDQPRARRLRVGDRLDRGEGLGADDEEGLVGVEPQELLRDVRTVHVGHELHVQAAVRVGAQRLVGHHRPQVRAADADVHHVLDRLAREAEPLARTHLLSEVAHLVQHLMDVCDHVLAVHHQHGVPWGAQRGVEHRPVLGVVDVLTPEHGVALLLEPRRAGEVHQEADRLGRHSVLGEVDVQVAHLGDHLRSPVRVRREQLAQVRALGRLVMRLQRRPLRGGRDVLGHGNFSLLSSPTSPAPAPGSLARHPRDLGQRPTTAPLTSRGSRPLLSRTQAPRTTDLTHEAWLQSPGTPRGAASVNLRDDQPEERPRHAGNPAPYPAPKRLDRPSGSPKPLTPHPRPPAPPHPT